MDFCISRMIPISLTNENTMWVATAVSTEDEGSDALSGNPIKKNKYNMGVNSNSFAIIRSLATLSVNHIVAPSISSYINNKAVTGPINVK